MIFVPANLSAVNTHCVKHDSSCLYCRQTKYTLPLQATSGLTAAESPRHKLRRAENIAKQPLPVKLPAGYCKALLAAALLDVLRRCNVEYRHWDDLVCVSVHLFVTLGNTGQLSAVGNIVTLQYCVQRDWSYHQSSRSVDIIKAWPSLIVSRHHVENCIKQSACSRTRHFWV